MNGRRAARPGATAGRAAASICLTAVCLLGAAARASEASPASQAPAASAPAPSSAQSEPARAGTALGIGLRTGVMLAFGDDFRGLGLATSSRYPSFVPAELDLGFRFASGLVLAAFQNPSLHELFTLGLRAAFDVVR